MPITFEVKELRLHIQTSPFLKSLGMTDIAESISLDRNSLLIDGQHFNSYHASVLSDFFRRKAIEQRHSFSFETVMSSGDKIDVLRIARSRGFRTYLYYIATEDPEINISRIQNRIALGGHGVPRDKVILRYSRSISFLEEAIRESDRAYLFDTSLEKPLRFAEITGGNHIEFKSDTIPAWSKGVVSHLMGMHLEDADSSSPSL